MLFEMAYLIEKDNRKYEIQCFRPTKKKRKNERNIKKNKKSE